MIKLSHLLWAPAFCAALIVPVPGAMAQHASAAPPDSSNATHSMHGMPGMDGMDMGGHAHASMAMHPLGYLHSRFGSGTSWLPDAAVARHLMKRAGAWTVMGHGVAFAGGVGMNGPRGDRKPTLPDMLMLMAERGSGPRTYWRLSTMFSTDAATVGGAGYPLLFQTGETWKGRALRDHQHPHNVFSEISGSVTRQTSSSTAATLYAAPVGEPALGPPAFPHRPVGSNDPLAPIGHHWQDATHIAYGVVTAGLEGRVWRLEGSTFNGREPGENRAEIRSPKFDSFSARLSVNPASCLALQASHGYLHRPEASHPENDTWRTTASAIWVHGLGRGASVDATVIWGRDRVDRSDFDSWLFEGEWGRERGVTPFVRLEYVEKNAEELVLPAAYDPETTYPLRQATLGAVYDFRAVGSLSLGLGAQAMVSLTPPALEGVYGRDPGGWAVFLRLRPRGGAHAMM